MPDSAKTSTHSIIPDADFYRTKAAQFLRLAESPHRHHERDTLLELAMKLQAMACAIDNESFSAAEIREMVVGR